MGKKYANIIIDISHEKVDRPFMYRVPEHLREKLEVGMTVRIPFGRGNHIREGYVMELLDEANYQEDKIKEINGIVLDAVKVQGRSIQLAWWMKQRYGSTMIAAMKTVLPVKQTMKHVQTKMVSLSVPKDQALSLMAEAGRRKQVGKVRLLEALIDGATVSYTMLTTKLGVSPQTIRSMREQCVIQVETFETYRNPIQYPDGKDEPLKLTSGQKRIVDDFLKGYDAGEKRPALLHGITGSGKTEVYMQIIEGMLKRGREVIVLIPEIALTYQTVQRFCKRFGDVVSIVNSRLSQGEKYDQFERAKKGEIKIMIGPRTALFTPFQKLGLIIIDEEHETSYKSDQMPRYQAAETAIELARLTDGRVLLGSATPSVASYYRAQKGEYRLYELKERIGQSELPKTEIIDLRSELRSGNKSILSRRLQEAMQDRLEKGEQIMLFLNRRGVSGFVSCRACGYVMKCPHCDVSLSEHRTGMVCHYCGYSKPRTDHCPSCGSGYIMGFHAGTQKVEETVAKMFPKARILRMDADTTKEKDAHEKILSSFANEEADILIGTQMIVKGHDFKKVTLVGVLAADLSLFDADYTSSERTFQLLVQAVGRAGRGNLAGEAIVQTYKPDHVAVVKACEQDYQGFYREEIGYRKLMDYPPASQLMSVMVLSKNEKQADYFARVFANVIQNAVLSSDITGNDTADPVNGKRDGKTVKLIGPAPAAIGKVNDVYRRVLYVKCDALLEMIRCKDILEGYCAAHQDEMKYVSVYYDLT